MTYAQARLAAIRARKAAEKTQAQAATPYMKTRNAIVNAHREQAQVSLNMRIFIFPDNAAQIRTVPGKNGEPLFVARDVLAAIGYPGDVGAAPFIGTVPAKWKCSVPIATPSGYRDMAMLTEQGLSFFLTNSRKQCAPAFHKWISRVVLPAISNASVDAPREQDQTQDLPAILVTDGYSNNISSLLENTSMTNLNNLAMSVFTFPVTKDDVRVTPDDRGEPWFVASDVAIVLGYSHVPHMTRMLDDDEKGVQNLDTPGGKQSMTVISESGLYTCILKSRRPEAKQFRKWVTSVVLPSIRKDGAYIMGEEKLATGEMTEDELIAKALVAAASKTKRLEAENAALRMTVDRFLESKGSYNSSLVAQSMGMGSAQELHGALTNLEVFDQRIHRYFKIRAQYVRRGWVDPKFPHNGEHAFYQVLWTPKGVIGISAMLGVTPDLSVFA